MHIISVTIVGDLYSYTLLLLKLKERTTEQCLYKKSSQGKQGIVNSPLSCFHVLVCLHIWVDANNKTCSSLANQTKRIVECNIMSNLSKWREHTRIYFGI